MYWTIITPSFGSLNGASQSALDLILASKINTKKLAVIYAYRSNLPNSLDNYNFNNIKIYKSASNMPFPNSKLFPASV